MRIQRGFGFGILVAFLAAALASNSLDAAIIVNDSWADAGRTNGADPQDTNWWTSTTSSAIEVSAGSLGLVSGTSGRGIHGTYPLVSLPNAGNAIKATFTFTTPATVGSGATAAFKIGFYNTNGNSGLAADLSASSTTPNPIYDPVPGYMMDFDVNSATNNITFREKDPVPGTSGQLLGTTTGYTQVGSGGGASYTFAANTTYTGVMMITRTAGGLTVSGSLSQGSTELSSHSVSEASPIATSFDMLAFHVNASIFGSSNAVNTANNGIDFSNITIERIPEPASVGLSALAALATLLAGRRRG